MGDATDINPSVVPEKQTGQDPDPALSKSAVSEPSHLTLVVVVALGVFLCEIVSMTVSRLLHLTDWRFILLDASILVVLLSPVLYVFMFRPLVRQIQERKRVEETLRESENRFRTVFHTSPDAITISRIEDGRILDVNDGFCRLTGYPREDVAGKSSLDLSLWTDAQDRRQMVAELQQNGRVDNFEAPFRYKNGRTGEGLISARLVSLNGDPHILAISRDISQWKKAQKRLMATHQFLEIANRHSKMYPLLEAFTSQIQAVAGCTAAGMRILDETGAMPFRAHKGFSRRFIAAENHRSVDTARCLCADVIRGHHGPLPPLVTGGGSFHVQSTTDFLASLSEADKNRLCGICNRFGYESVALIPIPSGGKILGLIHVADPRRGAFSEETIATLEAAALQLGPAIERVRAEEALQESYRELERRVAKRTARLAEANEMLSVEIQERRRKEEELLEQQSRLRSLSSELLLTEERERRLIATELHDGLGQILAVAKIKLDQLRADAPSGDFADEMDSVLAFVEQAIEEARSLTFELSPPVLYELGLEAALTWLAKQMREKHGLQVELRDDGRPIRLDDGCRVIAFQAARELLFNIVKHAGARSAAVSIQKDADAVRIDIEDDGVGFDPATLGGASNGAKSFGLFSIRERLEPLGGRMEIRSGPGRGTRVRLVLPVVCQTDDSGGRGHGH